MPEIKIMSIEQLLQIPNLESSYKHMIIFVTTKPNYYDFGCTNFALLNIADTDVPVISPNIISTLKYRISEGRLYDTIYVCCDAGLSRSPAVALFLARKLGEYEQGDKIDEKYRFLNGALYKRLMEINNG